MLKSGELLAPVEPETETTADAVSVHSIGMVHT